MKKTALLFLILSCIVLCAGESWEGSRGGASIPPSITKSETAENGVEYLIKVEAEGKYQGVIISFGDETVNLKEFAAVEFEFCHNLTKRPMGLAIHFTQASGGAIQGRATVQNDQWQKVVFQLVPESFIGDGCKNGVIGKCQKLMIYPYAALKAPGEYMKIRNLRFIPRQEAGNSRKLPVATYRYLTAPSSGDEKKNALTDGDRRNNVHYREYSEEPEIVFDLGGCYALDSLVLDAFAAPSFNFSNVTIQTSIDGKEWFPGGILFNQASGTEIKEVSYAFKRGERPVVGRYFKLKAVRPREDFSIDIAEVTFTGHIPSTEEANAAAEQNYEIGPAMPERTPENYAEIKAGDWHFWVSRANGVVNGVFYKGKLMVERFVPGYVLQSRAEDRECSGYDDIVENIVSSDSSVTVTVTNPKLPGLAIERTWRAEGNALWEKVTVINRSQKERLFLQLATETVFAQAFRAPSFYEMPSTSFTNGMCRIPANEIRMDRALTNIPCLALENGREKQTVWHVRHRFNDRFAYYNIATEDSNLQIFRASGWRLTSVTIVPADSPRQSFENRFSVTDGGMLKAYEEYINLPEVAQFRNSIRRAPSVRDVRMSIDATWDGEWPYARKKVMENYARAFSHRGTLSDCELVDLDGIWGDFPVEGQIRGHFGEKRMAEDVRRDLMNLKKSEPRLRLGIYTWLWSVFPWSTPFKNHPEWFVKTFRNGSRASYFPRVNVNYLRFWGIPESRQEALNQIVRFMDYYEQDSWYLDGGRPGAFAKDWDSMRIDDLFGKLDFLMSVREAVRKDHPERFVVFNECGANPIADMGFLECAGDVLTSEWRRGATIAWKFKMYSYQDPLHQSIYTYWRPGVDGIFHNYIAAIGLLPNYNSRNFDARDLPYTGARYDIRLAEIRDAAVAPDWRLDWNEELECMALAQQNNGWIFMQYHGDKPVVREVSADAAALGLKAPDKPVYTWHYTVRNAKKYPGIFGEQQISAAYGKTGWVADRAVTVEYLGRQPWSKRLSGSFEHRKDEAHLLMASQVPAVVLSIENDPMHYYLAGQPGIQVDGDQGKLVVRNEYKEAEIGMILEDGQVPSSLKVNGREAPFTVRTDRNFRCAVFKVEGGESRAEFTYTAEKPVVVTALEADCHGRTLKVNVHPENAPVQIYCDGALVLSRTGSFALELPETVRDGIYEVVAGSLKKTLNLKDLGTPLKMLPVLPLLPVKHDVKAVHRKIKGIEVLNQASCYTVSAGEAKTEPEKLKLSIGTLPCFESFYNQANAALNMKVRNYLKLRIVNEAVEHTRFDYAPERHTIKRGNPNTFLGLVIDFMTKSGGMVRSAAGLGLQSEALSKVKICPDYWGSSEPPQHVYELMQMLFNPDFEEKTCWIDLASLGAPADWTGEIWLTLSLANLGPDRRFQVEILETAERLPQKTQAVVPTEFGIKKQPVTYTIPKISGAKEMDKLPVMGQMIPEPGKGTAPLETFVKAAYDDQNLYFFYDCREAAGHIPACGNGRSGAPYNDDSVEIFLQRTDHPDKALHTVIGIDKSLYSEMTAFRHGAGMQKIKLSDIPCQVQIANRPPHWSAWVSLPWSAIGGKPAQGAVLGFNMMRNRFEQGQEHCYTLSNNGVYLSADQCRMILK